MGAGQPVKSLPRQPWIFVDVDGTLNARVIQYVRSMKANGYHTVLWSARGDDYALAAAERLECADAFDLIISKPGYLIDDQGWGWARYVAVIRSPMDVPPIPTPAPCLLNQCENRCCYEQEDREV